MDKRRYFIRKVLNAVLTIILVASFNFALFRILPGDPARLLLPKGKTDPSVIEFLAAARKVLASTLGRARDALADLEGLPS